MSLADNIIKCNLNQSAPHLDLVSTPADIMSTMKPSIQENYTLNKDRAINKKINASERIQDINVKLISNGVRVFFTSGAYELFKAASMQYYNQFTDTDFTIAYQRPSFEESGLRVSDVVRVVRNTDHRRGYTLNMYHTTSSIMVNGVETGHFISDGGHFWSIISLISKMCDDTGIDITSLNNHLRECLINISESGKLNTQKSGKHTNNAKKCVADIQKSNIQTQASEINEAELELVCDKTPLPSPTEVSQSEVREKITNVTINCETNEVLANAVIKDDNTTHDKKDHLKDDDNIKTTSPSSVNITVDAIDSLANKLHGMIISDFNLSIRDMENRYVDKILALQNDNMRLKVESKDAEINFQKHTISDLRKELAAKSIMISDLESKIIKLDSQLKNCAVSEGEISKLKQKEGKLDVQEETLRDIRNDVLTKDKRINELSVEIKNLECRLNFAIDEKIHYQRCAEALESQLLSTQERADKLQHQIDNLTSSLTKTSDELFAIKVQFPTYANEFPPLPGAPPNDSSFQVVKNTRQKETSGTSSPEDIVHPNPYQALANIQANEKTKDGNIGQDTDITEVKSSTLNTVERSHSASANVTKQDVHDGVNRETINNIDVLIVGNSHTSRFIKERIYSRKSCFVKTLRNKYIDDAIDYIKKCNKQPKAVVFQILSNDLSKGNVADCLKKAKALIQCVKEVMPGTNICISEALPRLFAREEETNEYMDKMLHLNNCLVNLDCHIIQNKDINIGDETVFDRDGIHLTDKGTAFLIRSYKTVLNELLGMKAYTDYQPNPMPNYQSNPSRNRAHNLTGNANYGRIRPSGKIYDNAFTLRQRDGTFRNSTTDMPLSQLDQGAMRNIAFQFMEKLTNFL